MFSIFGPRKVTAADVAALHESVESASRTRANALNAPDRARLFEGTAKTKAPAHPMRFLDTLASVIEDRKAITEANGARAEGHAPPKRLEKRLRQALVGAFEQLKQNGDFAKFKEIREALGEPLSAKELTQLQAIADAKLVERLSERVAEFHEHVVALGTKKDLSSDPTLLWQLADGDILKPARERGLAVPVWALELEAETRRWRPLIEALDRASFRPNGDVTELKDGQSAREREFALRYGPPARVVARLDLEVGNGLPREKMLELLPHSIANALNHGVRELEKLFDTQNPFLARAAAEQVDEIEKHLALATKFGISLERLADQPVGMGRTAKPRILGLARLDRVRDAIGQMAARRDALAAGPKGQPAEWRNFTPSS